MKRRNFIKNVAGVTAATTFLPVACKSIEDLSTNEKKEANWLQLGSGENIISKRKETLTFEVVVIGAGMAGISAAVSSARNGAKTLLINDRSVLGGNASSEIRVTVNGVNSIKPQNLPERETGIIEEILIENRVYNQQESYPVWDHVVYDYVTRQPNLEVFLNTQAIDAEMDGNKIIAAKCWQSTTEMELTIKADIFIDCSGDGLLGAKAGALYRTGREGKKEFNEKYAPDVADGWQMGNTIMMQSKDMGRPMPYTAPSFVIKYDAEKAHDRKIRQFIDGFWWVELGSEFDNIADYEKNRHKLMGYLHGVWDHVKNSGKYPESANYALDWVGSFPGRRESRRFIGDFILSEKDLTEYHHFDDAVAYGGWSLDEHCPGGIESLHLRPSFFHQKFKQVYEVPFRSLYSKNIDNLMFAGRNVSQTHIALSSSRIQGTCALMGQAVGTAASICIDKKVIPRKVGQNYINELQEQLLRDDAFIPNRPANDQKDLAQKAVTIFGSSTKTGDAKLLTNGISRDINGQTNHWQSEGLPATLQLEWENPINLATIELKADTNLQRNIMMKKQPTKKNHTTQVPPELIKVFDVEARINGVWTTIAKTDKNITRLMKVNFDSIKATAIRVNIKETYGHPNAKLFEVRCYA